LRLVINEPGAVCFLAYGSRAQQLATKAQPEDSGVCSTTGVADPQLSHEDVYPVHFTVIADRPNVRLRYRFERQVVLDGSIRGDGP